MTKGRALRVVSVVAGVAAVTAAGWWWTVGRRPAPLGVVIVTLDTTRADRLSPYGFMNVSLPHLERLAREGVVFDQATSVAPLTLPAHASLFTGLLPPNHRVRDNADTALAESERTLAEILLDNGFRTGAFVGSIVLDPDRGLHQGFEQYAGVVRTDRTTPEQRQRRASEVMDDAIRWLASVGDQRFLLWTHLYDAHRPYDPPEPYGSIYAHNPYVGEIAYADSQIGRLLDALDERQLLDRTIVVVTGDHGESLGEHGERDHGVFVYENVLRVPLIVRAPGLQPLRAGQVVRLTDVMPTVLDLLDVPSPPTDGVSLVNVMRGQARDLRLEAYSESLYPLRLGWSPLHALRDGRFKLIVAPRPELYDVLEDPTESQNLYDSRRALAARMAERADRIAKGRMAAPTAPETSVSADAQARLTALGYVASPARQPSSDVTPPPDPKDCVGSLTDRPPAISAGPSCGLLSLMGIGESAP